MATVSVKMPNYTSRSVCNIFNACWLSVNIVFMTAVNVGKKC